MHKSYQEMKGATFASGILETKNKESQYLVIIKLVYVPYLSAKMGKISPSPIVEDGCSHSIWKKASI